MGAIRYWLWLSGQMGVSPQAKSALLAHYGDAEEAFFAPTGDYEKIPGISRLEAERLEKRDLSVAEHILYDCSARAIDIVTMQDASYPKMLKNIYAPPAVLYVKGRLPDFDAMPVVSVIGTRKATAYGIKMARNIAFDIARSGGAVVSMLSEGIDRHAAQGCILGDGYCVGVLGAGHGEIYGFYRDVVAHGALISEYPPNTPPKRHFYRERNRIASGISRGVVVVEAPEKSGALLFATEALEQGREIFAVPGNADALNSVGTNDLIKQGAKPVTCGWDVMSEYEYLFPGRIRKPDSDAVLPEIQEQEREEKAPAQNEEQKSTIKAVDSKKPASYIDLREQLSGLNEDQLAIVTAIDKDETHIDDLIEKTGLSAAKVLAQLTVLEIKGFVRRSAGRRVSLNIKSK